MSEINFNTYIDPNAIEEKSIEKSHLSEEVQGLLDSAVQPDQVSSLAVTGITMNNSARTITNGVVDLGTVITGLTAATTEAAGIVRLSNSTGSTDENLAATPKAVALVSDLAIDAYNKTTANTESINTLRNDFNTLVSGDTDSAITTFNEITKFLEDFNTGETLTEKLYEINTRIDESTSGVSINGNLQTGATVSFTGVVDTIKMNNVEITASADGLIDLGTVLRDYTEQYTGTITGIKMNGTSKGTSGEVDLGTVVTGLTTASTSSYGITQLSSAINSDNENVAATPKAVNETYKLANSANTKVEELAAIVNENEEVISGTLNEINEKVNNCGNISAVTIDQQIDDANITNYITNPVFTEELNKKQDKISDLSTIRSNAEKATTAVQPNQVSSLAVTGIKMNGVLKGTNGTVDLGTVVTGEHLTEVVSDITTGHTANQLYGKNNTESRSVISDPNEYNHLFKFTGLKNNSTLGLNNEGNYSSVVGVRAWNDSSGGPAHEFAYTQNGKVYHRYGNSSGDTSWQNWKKIAESDDLTQYVTTGTSQTISGVKNFTKGIEIGQGSSGTTSIITNQIDSGELKVWHSGTTKGFIIRTNKKTNPNASIFPLELLTTNNLQSYQYNFPTQTGGIIVLNAKVNDTLYNPTSTGGTIDLGNDFVKTGNTQDISGVKNYISNIGINSKTVISSQIDPGELKVCHSGTSKGFIIRTNTGDTSGNVYKLQLLTTDGLNSSYTYDFPKANGDIILFKNVTHSDLLNLRNNSQLVPGGVYRITDYSVTINMNDLSTGNHRFDILVQALSKNELSENAKACLHDNDTYFANTKINAWELKYCLDNDGTRFVWAGTNDKGVIYYMKDEWGNEAPYDFKNIKFTKNNIDYYTFSHIIDGVVYDGTVETKYFYGNKILPTYDLQDCNMVLPRNIFINQYIPNTENLCISNIIGENCTNNVFGHNCKCNILGSYCTNNTFGDYCQFNTLDDYCTNNTFGDYCQSNTFNVNCTGNTFGSYILRCKFGDKCYNCKLTNNGNDNGTLLSYVKMVEFGSECTNVNLWTENNSSSSYIQNYILSNSLTGAIKITGNGTNERNRGYITKIARNSSGDIKIYCEADLIL